MGINEREIIKGYILGENEKISDETRKEWLGIAWDIHESFESIKYEFGKKVFAEIKDDTLVKSQGSFIWESHA